VVVAAVIVVRTYEEGLVGEMVKLAGGAERSGTHGLKTDGS
jgi:hypothetical protein